MDNVSKEFVIVIMGLLEVNVQSPLVLMNVHIKANACKANVYAILQQLVMIAQNGFVLIIAMEEENV
jgi:hypothetical protein